MSALSLAKEQSKNSRAQLILLKRRFTLRNSLSDQSHSNLTRLYAIWWPCLKCKANSAQLFTSTKSNFLLFSIQLSSSKLSVTIPLIFSWFTEVKNFRKPWSIPFGHSLGPSFSIASNADNSAKRQLPFLLSFPSELSSPFPELFDQFPGHFSLKNPTEKWPQSVIIVADPYCRTIPRFLLLHNWLVILVQNKVLFFFLDWNVYLV